MSTSVITPSTLQYIFIDDGCIVDTTTANYASSNQMENRFSIKAFEFENRLLASRQNSDIFLQCDVMLCDANGNNTRCSQACLSGALRGKRSAGRSKSIKRRNAEDFDDDEINLAPPSIAQSPPQELATRFILVVDPDKDSGSSKETNYTNWILIGIGVLLLLVVIFFAYRMLIRRREQTTHKQMQNVWVPPGNEKVSYSQNIDI